MTAPFRATYRLQLGTDLDFARARELVPYVADLGASHLYLSPSFQARPGSTHGYDVIDPGKVSDDLGGEAGLRALSDAAHEHGVGLILDIVPNHMAADDANRYWADPALREQLFDVDPVSGRHRRFFDIDELAGVRIEDPEVFAAVSGLALRLVAEGVVDGLRVDHPDGLANPVEYLRRLRDGGAEHVWVEKILMSAHPPEELRGDWPGDGTVGYEFANDIAALFVDPAAEAPLTELYVSLVGDERPFGAVAAEAKLEQASTTFTPEGAGPRGAARRRAPRAPGGDPPRADARRRSRARRVRAPLPADDAAGDGQGCRGHGVLPLRAAAGAQRGRRRPVALRHRRRHLPRRQPQAAAAQPAGVVHPRHQALGRRAGAAVRADRDPRRVGRRGALLVRGQRAAARRRPRRPDAGRGAAHLPDPGGRMADRGRPARGLPGEGAARGQAVVELDHARRGARGGGQALRRRPPRPRPVPLRLRRGRRARGRAGRARRAGPDAAQAHRPRPARRLPGRRAVALLARRPRQPPAGRLGGAARGAGGAARRRAADVGDDQAAPR